MPRIQFIIVALMLLLLSVPLSTRVRVYHWTTVGLKNSLCLYTGLPYSIECYLFIYLDIDSIYLDPAHCRCFSILTIDTQNFRQAPS